jgi:hypothetical protein
MSRVVVNEIEAKIGGDITFNDTVKIDTIKGKTTADVINVQTGSVTSVLQLGIASHALHFNHKTPAIIKSWNLSSVADDAAGEYTVTITTAYSDINYIMTNSNNFDANGQGDAAGGQLHSDNSSGNEVAPTTTAYKVRTDKSGTATGDLKYGYTTIHGDIA